MYYALQEYYLSLVSDLVPHLPFIQEVLGKFFSSFQISKEIQLQYTTYTTYIPNIRWGRNTYIHIYWPLNTQYTNDVMVKNRGLLITMQISVSRHEEILLQIHKSIVARYIHISLSFRQDSTLLANKEITQPFFKADLFKYGFGFFMKKKFQQKNSNNTDQAIGVMHTNALTEVAGEGGTDWAPQILVIGNIKKLDWGPYSDLWWLF